MLAIAISLTGGVENTAAYFTERTAEAQLGGELFVTGGYTHEWVIPARVSSAADGGILQPITEKAVISSSPFHGG